MKYKISELAKVSAGQSAPQGESNYSDFGTPFVKAGDLKDLINGKSISEIQKVTDEIAKKHKLKLYPKNSILFAKSGMSCTKGYVYTLPQDAYVVSHLAIISPKIKNISIYLNYYFRFFKPSSLIKDQSYPSISLTDIKNMDVDIPEETKRVEICDNLKLIEKIIRLYKKELANLEALIKARFVEMFGDPVGNDYYWKQTKLKEVSTKIGSGATPRGGRDSYCSEGISLIRSLNVYDGKFEYKDLAHISNEQAKKLNNVTVNKNDILINITGASVARTCIVPEDVLPARVNQHVSIIRCKADILNPVFINRMFLSDSYKNQLLNIGESGGATRQAITKDQLESLTIIVPPIKLQNQFAAFVQKTDKSKFFIFRIQACYNIFIQIDFNSQIF